MKNSTHSPSTSTASSRHRDPFLAKAFEEEHAESSLGLLRGIDGLLRLRLLSRVECSVVFCRAAKFVGRAALNCFMCIFLFAIVLFIRQ